MGANVTYIFSPSTTAKSADVNQNFQDLIDAIDMAMPSSENGHGIIAFSGAIANIPAGWYLCDGNNGTPDLRGRMIIGAGQGEGLTNRAVGDIGGEEEHALVIAEMPIHTHIQNAHQHDLASYADASGSNHCLRTEGRVWGSQKTNHATATNQNTGGGEKHENMSPFYVLAWIMKS